MRVPAEFFEEYPLYRKLLVDSKEVSEEYPPINMYCPKCKSSQTFKQVVYHGGAAMFPGGIRSKQQVISSDKSPEVRISHIKYRCASCERFQYHFLLKIQNGRGIDKSYIMKVGQEPPWSIEIDKPLAKALGKEVALFKKGLICESQGYGIGAFIYYRRVVEDLIERLLEDIATLINASEMSQYQKALSLVRQTPVASEKIKLVKDLLPDILRPEGINPLEVLYKALSVGVHQLSDEECLEMAETVRETLSYLVIQVSVHKRTSKEFTEKMRNLLSNLQRKG